MSSAIRHHSLRDIPDAADLPKRQSDWRRGYASRLVISDVLVLVWAIVGSAIVTFGLTGWPVVAGSVSRLGLSYPVLLARPSAAPHPDALPPTPPALQGLPVPP